MNSGVIIAAMILMPILLIGCGKAENGSPESTTKVSMPDEQYYGYIKVKFDAADSVSERVGLMRSYLSAYPKGKHMGEATALLEQAKEHEEEVNRAVDKAKTIAKKAVQNAEKKAEAVEGSATR